MLRKSEHALAISILVCLLTACQPNPETVQIDQPFHEWGPAHADLLSKLPEKDAEMMARFVPEYVEAYNNPTARVPGLNYPFELSGKSLGDAVLRVRDFYAQKDRLLAEATAKQRARDEKTAREREVIAERNEKRAAVAAAEAAKLAEEARLSSVIPNCPSGQTAMKVIHWYQAPRGSGLAAFERVDLTVVDARSGELLFKERVDNDEPIARHKPGRNFCWTPGDWAAFCSPTLGSICDAASSKKQQRIERHRNDP